MENKRVSDQEAILIIWKALKLYPIRTSLLIILFFGIWICLLFGVSNLFAAHWGSGLYFMFGSFISLVFFIIVRKSYPGC